ncbi:MAG TPA: DUF4160 domain-containing protein [Segetibacter sp.]
MPTLFIVNGFRFFFYSNESNEPAHLHVTKGNAAGKVWLEPEIDVAYFKGFTNSEERFIQEIVKTRNEEFKTKWHEYFAK